METGGFRKLVQNMNRNLPQRRRSLEELMKEAEPAVLARNGTSMRISREELERIAALVPKYEWNRLLLPIIIEMTSDFGETAARIRGKVECSLVVQLLGIKRSEETLIILHMHDISALRRALPTATNYGFFMST